MPTPNYGGYQNQRNDTNYKYSTDAATNAYGRFVSQQRGNRNLGDTQRQFGRQMPGYKAQFGQRGLSGGGINSGAMQQSMQNYVGDYGRQYGRQMQDNATQLQGYDQQQAQLDSWRQQSLAGIDQAESDDIANSAMNLEWLRAQVGGL